MPRHTGVQSGLHAVAHPAFLNLSVPPSLSKNAKLRLAWIDFNRKHQDVALTCRHFGIGRSLFYKWNNRYLEMGFRGLENVSKRPLHTRTPTTPLAKIDTIRALRRAHPEYSKYKLQVILERDHGLVISASTIGRIISRYKLFYARPVKPKSHPYRVVRHRLPKQKAPWDPGELVEVDVKHLPFTNSKRYAFVTIDRATRRTSIHVSSTISSSQGAVAWNKAIQALHLTSPMVLTDNGSENLGAFAKLLQDTNTPHYFARPHTPKDKPYVERVIGTLERECIQWGGIGYDLAEQQEVIDEWLMKYHSFRPHQALGYLTPDAYAEKLRAEVSTM